MKFFTDFIDKKNTFYGKSRTNCILFPAWDGKTILAETEKRGFQIWVWDYQGKEVVSCRYWNPRRNETFY